LQSLPFIPSIPFLSCHFPSFHSLQYLPSIPFPFILFNLFHFFLPSFLHRPSFLCSFL
jgi:hypothetical protein